MSQTVLMLEELFNLPHVILPGFFLGFSDDLQALARWNLKEIKLEVVGSVLNFRKAARRRRIALLKISLRFRGQHYLTCRVKFAR